MAFEVAIDIYIFRLFYYLCSSLKDVSLVSGSQCGSTSLALLVCKFNDTIIHFCNRNLASNKNIREYNLAKILPLT